MLFKDPKLSQEGKRRWKMFFAGSIALLVLFLTSEILYRTFWACKRALAARAGENGYFALYMVGESTAAGEPYDPGITPAAIVASQFGGKLLGRPIQEFNLAKRGESVYPQEVAFEHALRTRNRAAPGAVLIYTGNSDAGNKRGLPVLEWLRENVFSRSMLLGDLFFYTEKRFRVLSVRTLDTYEYHLRRIVELSLKNGLVPVLATVPTNIADMDPGLFPGTAPLANAEVREIPELLGKGRALEDRGRAAEALAYYSGLAGAHPFLRAYLAYRTGKCCQALGRYTDAARYYREAADFAGYDNFRRATSAQNDFIRVLAKRYSVPLADAMEVFERNSPHGLVGSGLFSDGHHPNMSGYLLLTDAYAGKLSEVFHEPVLRRFSGPEEVFRAFSYDKEKQAEALITSGRWLFNVALRHFYPGDRLRMARACFQKAILLSPDNFSAWLALGLAETALRGPLATDQEPADWLARQGLCSYHGWEFEVAPAQLETILARLISYGLPATLAEEISLKAAKAR